MTAAVVFLLAVSASWGSGAGTAAVALTMSKGQKPEPASHVKTRWRATVATLPANAATGESQAVSISSISCASRGNCTAVGTYNDKVGGQEGLLLTEKAGHWAKGVEAVLPADAGSDPQVSLNSVSCASAGNCTAVGTYSNPSAGIYSEGGTSGLLLTEKAGHWAAGLEGVLPTDAGPGSSWVGLQSVSCASAGNCTAVGNYGSDNTDVTEGLLLTEKAGHWTARGVSVGTGLYGVSIDLSSVSCASDGSCSTVGFYEYSSGRDSAAGEPLLLTKRRGTWRRVNAVMPPDGPGEGVVLTSVSCVSGGNCGAAGLYNISVDSPYAPEGVLLTEKAGKWRRGVRAVPPKNATSDYVGPVGISCGAPGECVVMADYEGDSGPHLTLLTEKRGKWRRGVEAAPPHGARGPEESAAISCASPGNCTAVGSFGAADIYSESAPSGLLLTEIADSWARGVRPPHFSGSFDSVSSVSCASPGNCGAVGVDWKSGGPVYGILLDSTTEPCVVPRLKGTTLHRARPSIESHNCSVGTIKHAPSRTIETGHVISQKPHPGRHRAPGTKVNLKVSSGH